LTTNYMCHDEATLAIGCIDLKLLANHIISRWNRTVMIIQPF